VPSPVFDALNGALLSLSLIWLAGVSPLSAAAAGLLTGLASRALLPRLDHEELLRAEARAAEIRDAREAAAAAGRGAVGDGAGDGAGSDAAGRLR